MKELLQSLHASQLRDVKDILFRNSTAEVGRITIYLPKGDKGLCIADFLRSHCPLDAACVLGHVSLAPHPEELRDLIRSRIKVELGRQ